MASHNKIMVFSVDPRALLGLMFSLAAILSMNASAAYTNCADNKFQDTLNECFSLQRHSDTLSFTNRDQQYSTAAVAPNHEMIALTNPAALLVVPVPHSASFSVNQHRGGGEHLSESLPLILLFGVLLGVILVRAKSFNNK